MEKCNCQRYKVRSDEEKKKYINHLNKVIGQLNGVKKMIEDDRYCDDVITQIAASSNSLKSLASKILDNHMHTCMLDDILAGKIEAIDEVIELYRRFER